MRAFSLVELSIVLVILGLLTGGIVAGQSLIRAAELRSAATDLQKTSAAVNTFRDKYFALPGDMRNATVFWGIAAGTTGTDDTCWAASGSGTSTCNGNNDGFIENASTCTDGTQVGCYQERLRGWQHLANADLIEGRYTGIPSVAAETYSWLAGTNVPRSRINNAANIFNGFLTPTTTGSWAFPGMVGNYLLIITSTSTGTQSILSAQESWNIDTKLDDGMPGTGRVMSANATSNPGCVSGDAITATYLLSGTGLQCRHVFMKLL